jgi:ankyrin repeat protein
MQARILGRSQASWALGLLVSAIAWMPVHPVLAADAPLISAAKAGDVDDVRELIRGSADVNAQSADGSTPLLWAAYHGDVKMVEALLAVGAKPDVANRYGVTPLLQASRSGDGAVIAALLEHGASATLTHPDGETPLMGAARVGRMEAVELLLAAGVDVNAADSFKHETALMRAAAEGHAAVVDRLLAAGANPNLQARVTTLAERKNADYPSGGFSALMWAVRNGHVDIVQRLVAAGADLNLRNGDGATAMMIAIVNDRYDLAATLVELGADVNDGSLYHAVEMRDATTDWYARDGSKLRANHHNEHTALDLIALLLDKGADPNKPFVGQMHSATMCCDTVANGSPFFRAAIAADVEALKLLLAKGADIEWTPSNADGLKGANTNVGLTPLMVAMKGGRGVPFSAGPGFTRNGPPPFREPSNREPADAVKLLLAAGANPNAVAPTKATVLHLAVESRNLETLRALTAAGASLTAKNADGLTPLQVAEKLKPDDPENRNPFGPQNFMPVASREDVVALLREAAAGSAVAHETHAAVEAGETR